MKDSGRATKILGIRLTQRQGEGYVQMDQEAYTAEILGEFGFSECRPQSTPLSPSVKLDDENSPLLNYLDHRLFRRIIGRTTFLVVGTRPDISFSVNRLSQYLADPHKVHLEAAKHILRYLAGTLTFKLIYRKAQDEFYLVGYADSALANSRGNKLSTSTYVFYLSNNSSPVCWKTRKQPIVAQSTTEAEYVALAEAVKQSIWLSHLMFSLGKQQREVPSIIYEDNRGAISLAKNPGNHGKTKHIMLRYHAVRDAVERREVKIEYRHTGEMIADGLTKSLTSDKIVKLTRQLHLH